MAVDIVGLSTFASGSGALSVGAVAGVQADDLILLFCESANQAVSTPSGFTEVPGSPSGTGTAGAAGAVRLTVFYRIATGADSSTSVADSGDHTTAIKLALRGVDTTTPIHYSAFNPISSPDTSWGVPLAYASGLPVGSMVLCGVANDRDANSQANLSNLDMGMLTGQQILFDRTVDTGTGGGIGILTGVFDGTHPGSNGWIDNAASNRAVLGGISIRSEPIIIRTGTASITESSQDAAQGSGAVRVTGTSMATDAADSAVASGTVVKVARGTAALFDSPDTVAGIGTVPHYGPLNFPPPLGGRAEFSAFEFAAAQFAADEGEKDTSADAAASLSLSAAFVSGVARLASASPTISLTSSMSGGAKQAAGASLSMDLQAAFEGQRYSQADAGAQISLSATFVPADVRQFSFTSGLSLSAEFHSLTEPETVIKTRIDADMHGAVVQQSRAQLGFSLSAYFHVTAIQTATTQIDAPKLDFAARGAAIANMHASGQIALSCSMRGGSARTSEAAASMSLGFQPRMQAIAQASASASIGLSSTVHTEYGWVPTADMHATLSLETAFRAGAIQQGSAFAAVTLGLAGSGGAVRPSQFASPLRIDFMPAAGNQFLRDMLVAAERAQVPVETRAVVVTEEDRELIAEGRA